ncbi:Inositol-1-phosphate synthase (EC [Olavius algarvensis associated proteobacterium Delta 3]|nr:Inositol-1-phosphate synthase (EC [Olavius algarvensis associated proteobacterium Delta 3]
MTISNHFEPRPLLILVAGGKGAIGTTLVAAAAALRKGVAGVADHLNTNRLFSEVIPLETVHVGGWDVRTESLRDCAKFHRVLPGSIREAFADVLDVTPMIAPPAADETMKTSVERIAGDIDQLRGRHPDALPVFVNLLPACAGADADTCRDLGRIFDNVSFGQFPDLAYGLAAVHSGVPVVNFTPNVIEVSPLLNQAAERRVPLCGRDGKTGQTYFKLVLASALKARHLYVDGWYSMNILGNEDGRNLMDPDRARRKLANKTNLLDQALGYPVGERYGTDTHRVHIDYYPPRGDAKEAWDVIDMLGLFDLPMSIRVNLQGRDSILAAPMVLDLARWMAILQMLGRSGPIPELGFYFKKPIGENAPVTYPDQLAALSRLESECVGQLE